MSVFRVGQRVHKACTNKCGTITGMSIGLGADPDQIWWNVKWDDRQDIHYCTPYDIEPVVEEDPTE